MPSWFVRYRSRPVLPAAFLVFFFTLQASAQLVDYEVIFGENWHKAEAWLIENEQWMKPAVEKSGIPYPVAIAVIFPEIVRYSALRDKMETALLKTLYINLGDQYADFSIGIFQMKPSYAEKIREKAPSYMGHRAKRIFRQRSVFKNDREYRASIVSDLEDPQKQINYLIALIKICEASFRLPAGEEKIKFLSTAYNYDFNANEEEIIRMESLKFFNIKLYKSQNYSYADVSLFWYRKHNLHNANQ